MKNAITMDKFYSRLCLSIIAIFLVCAPLSGCKYGSIVSIAEQIAIYQNKGFIKIENPTDTIVINNTELKTT